MVEPDGVTKYGLVEGKHGHERLCLPPSEHSGSIKQLSATPRHLLAVTTDGGKLATAFFTFNTFWQNKLYAS